MIVQIANPIYDSVFKYLMEDERIAKTILSALLKKDVVSIEARPHEYTNQARDKISMFRIDFSATVRESDGSEHLILIELQKTWLETETLRFRQYLGAQYSDKRNIRHDSHDGFAIPMVTIYLLGHRVGNIEVPVVYVNHKSYDYDGNEVKKGIPDPFIESLVHNSIIVQIPLLRGQVNNHLYKVLSVFDQTQVSDSSHHLLSLDGKYYEGDDNMEYIVHKLTEAAASAELRQDMNVEDEFFSAIENRDTAIMNRDKKIKDQDKKIKDQDEKIEKIKDQDEKIKDQDEKIKDQDEKIKDQDEKIKDQDEKIKERDKTLSEKNNQLRQLVLALRDKGQSLEDISKLVNLDVDALTDLLESC